MEGLKCSDDREVYVGQVPADGCERRKWLHEDGRIIETRCLTTSCNKNGLPCYKSDFVALFSECHNSLQSPIFMKFPYNSVLKPQTFEFINTKRKEICCRDSTRYFKLYGSKCGSIKEILKEDNICNGSETFSLLPCSSLNQQENSNFCKIRGIDCVLEKSFLSVCSDIHLKSMCDVKNLPCEGSVVVGNI